MAIPAASITAQLCHDPAPFAVDTLFAPPLRSRRDVLMDAVSDSSLELEHAGSLVLELWLTDVHAGDMSSQTYERYAQLSKGFIRYALARGHCTLDDAAAVFEEWRSAHGRDRSGAIVLPGLAVQHLRACAIRALYKTARFLALTNAHLSYTPGNTETTRQGRPLNLAERTALHHVVGSDGETRVGAAIALGFAGAGTADIGNLRIKDVHIEDGTITLPGGGRTFARIVAIPGEWERTVLINRIAYQLSHGAAETDGVVVTRKGSDASRQAGAAIAVTRATELAGLRNDRNVKPASLQRLAATITFDTTGDISEAALILGTSSLDTAAQAITWNWAANPRPVLDLLPDYQPRVLR